MAIYRGTGGASDSTDDSTISAVTTQAGIATTKANEAASSATNANTSATNAAASATAASGHASTSSDNATASSGSATDASNYATAASNSATAASNSATAAANSASTANSTEVQAVAAKTTEITGVYNDIANVNTVAGNIADVNTVATNSSNITAVAGDASDIGTVAGSISNVNTVGDNIASVNTVAGNNTNINTVAADASDIGTVAGISGNVTTVAGISSDVTTVAGLESKMDTVIADASDIGTVAGNIGDVTTVAGISSDVDTVAGISADVTYVADNMTDVQNATTSATNAAASASTASNSASAASTSAGSASSSASSASTSATNASNSATAASNSATAASASKDAAASSAQSSGQAWMLASSRAFDAAASESNAATSETNAASSASAAATSATNAATSETNAAASATDSSNAASTWSNYYNTYVGASSSEPTVDVQGNALVAGALYFNTTNNTTYVWTGSAWNAVANNNIINPNVALTQDLATNGNDIKFGDNDKATFGAGDDLQIYHQSSNGNSIIKESGGGILSFQTNGSQISFYDTANSQNLAEFKTGAECIFRHNGSFKLKTASTGIVVNGTATMGSLSSLGATYSKIESTASPTLNTDTHVGEALWLRSGGTSGVNNTQAVLGFGKADGGNKKTGAAIASVQTEADKDKVGIELYRSGSSASVQTMTKGFTLAASGDISFYEDTGTTPKLFWDASAESLGIGTTAPERKLHISSGGIQIGALIQSASPISARLALMDANTSSSSQVGIGATGNNLGLYAGGSAQVTVNSSGNVGIGTSSPAAKLHIENGDMRIEKDTKATIGFRGHTAGSTALAFRDSNAAVDRMTIDASGNVGIGGSTSISTAVSGDNVAPKLIVEGTTATSIAVLRQDTSIVSGNSLGSLGFYGTDTTSNTPVPLAAVQALASGTHAAGDNPTDLRFMTTADGSSTLTERMRIDSSGNLLVGKTTSSTGATGAELRNHGVVEATRDGGACGIFNRLNSDGELLNFRKDGSTVGGIRSDTGRLVIDAHSDGSALILEGSNSSGTTTRLAMSNAGGSEAFRPFNADSDALFDLGSSARRFKDLHLSGTANVGSTSSLAETAGGDTQLTNTNAGADLFLVSARRLRFNTAGSERARIDSSGNLLVGKTASDNTTVGTRIDGTGLVSTVTDGDVTLLLNRKTSDGPIALFRKDGTNAGIIGTFASDITIGKTGAGLRFEDSTQTIRPHNVSTNVGNDANVTLGNSDTRFKDLYLSGGVYLGGTGAANKLDDYEEGTWTPTLTTDGTDFTSVTYDQRTGGSYTKIGRMVHFQMTLVTDAITAGSASGNVVIGGLPFTPATVSGAGTDQYSACSVAQGANWNSSNNPTSARVHETSTYIDLFRNGTTRIVVADAQTGGNDNYVNISGTYTTA